jgi:glycosidase
MAVLSYTLPGIPLVYNGQEAKLDKKLAFFEKDPIEWKNIDLELFFAGLNALKKQHPALWNGTSGGAVQLLEVGNDKLFAFKRQQGKRPCARDRQPDRPAAEVQTGRRRRPGFPQAVALAHRRPRITVTPAQAESIDGSLSISLSRE